MLGVQAEGASAIHDAFQGHEDIDDIADTIADSIAVGRPRNTINIRRAPQGEAAETPCWSPTRRFSRPRSSSGARRGFTPSQQGDTSRRRSGGAGAGHHRARRNRRRRLDRLRPERYREREESDGRRQPNRTRTIRKWKRCSGTPGRCCRRLIVDEALPNVLSIRDATLEREMQTCRTEEAVPSLVRNVNEYVPYRYR